MSDRYLASEKQMLINGIGTELCWGWSPAVDMLQFLPPLETVAELYDEDDSAEQAKHQDPTAGANVAAPSLSAAKKAAKKDDDLLDELLAETKAEQKKDESDDLPVDADGAPEDDAVFEEVNLLLCGASDVRHIILTMSRMHRVSQARGVPQRVHFYLYEPNLRVHCRHVFFLQLLNESMFTLSELEDRVSMFLELFGNTRLRDITATQLKAVAKLASRTIGDEEGPLAKIFDFSDMKAKERDFVEDQLRQWTKDTTKVHVDQQWNHRLRTEMAERYDNKDNLIDWDFNFKMHEYTNAIKFPEYRDWRNTGIAYDYCHINPRKGFQYDYTAPNKTICQYDRRGNGLYYGDIKNGPFAALGVATENKELHRRSPDGTLKFGNGIIAMHNLRAQMYELLTGKEWPWADHSFAWDDAKNYNYLPPGTPSDVEYAAKLPDVRFHFIGLELERFLLRNREKAEPVAFDAAFIGSNSTQFISPSLLDSMAPDGVVIAETIKFVVDANDEMKESFVDKLRGLADAGNWEHAYRDTGKLHHAVPPPRKYEIELSEAQQKTQQRLQSPHQLVFRKKEAAPSKREQQ